MKRSALIATAKLSLAVFAISFVMSSCKSSTAAYKGRHLCPAYSKVDNNTQDIQAKVTPQQKEVSI